MKGWKTIVVNGLLALVYLLAWGPLTQWVNPQYLVLATTAINFGLRFLTTTPVGQSQ